MNTKPAPICGQHKQPKEWKQTTYVYSEDGITVSVPNIYAWVCPVDGEAAFTPETADELFKSVRQLLATAKESRAHQSLLKEYSVSVSSAEQLRPAA
ncbi:MAG: YgiT-type zinc finger protein [Blastocatellia bacterium]|nr:YgiT-type zinc finger protein [Blastocatellia bacterium]